MQKLLLVSFVIAVVALTMGPEVSAQVSGDPRVAAILEPVREKYHLPAMAAAMFTTNGVEAMAAVGVRKSGTHVAVTTDDLWHLGSDGKIMTAMLAGTFVAEKKLAWDGKVITYFPEWAGEVPAAMREITIAQVLRHQAGLSGNLSLWERAFLHGSIPEQRRQAAEDILKWPAYAPGTFHYANNDYVLIGAILEKISGKPWEDLMRERIFAPLHMDSAGFGGTGTIGKIDQPWPHLSFGWPAPVNGPDMDNSAYMGPAGRIHCSMTDWARFLADQLRGGNVRPALLPADVYTLAQTPGPDSSYGFGWDIRPRKWAQGKMLVHSGSNTMNTAVCWLAPSRGFGVLVCTNQGGDLFLACNSVAEALIKLHFGDSVFDKPSGG